MVFMAILPAGIGIAILLFFLFLSLKTKKWIYMRRELFASLVIAFFFIHPTLSKALFSMFSCKAIDNSEQWLTIDMNIPCYDSEHIFYMLAVGLPSILIWVIGLPIFCLFILYKNKRDLDELWLRLQYGFLISGYSKRHYYWEFVITFRKIIVICCSVFLTNSIPIQALTVQAVLIGFFLLQLKVRPYTLKELNSTELKGILVADITIFCGLYYLTESLSEGSSWFFFFIIIGANAVFVFYWLMGFLGHVVDLVLRKVPSIGMVIKPRLFERDSYIESFINNIPKSYVPNPCILRIQNMSQLHVLLLSSMHLPTARHGGQRSRYQPNQPPIPPVSSLISTSRLPDRSKSMRRNDDSHSTLKSS